MSLNTLEKRKASLRFVTASGLLTDKSRSAFLVGYIPSFYGATGDIFSEFINSTISTKTKYQIFSNTGANFNLNTGITGNYVTIILEDLSWIVPNKSQNIEITHGPTGFDPNFVWNCSGQNMLNYPLILNTLGGQTNSTIFNIKSDFPSPYTVYFTLTTT